MTISEETGAVSPRRVLFVSLPRTASNLLLKMLNVHKQPNILTNDKGGYFFYPYFVNFTSNGISEKPSSQWSDEEKRKLQNAFQGCIQNLEDWSAQAESQNKIMFAKEHAFWFYNPASLQKLVTGVDNAEFMKDFRSGIRIPERYGHTQSYSASNETILSDEYLRSWQIAFVIRHPALAWPSVYRAVQKVAVEMGMDEERMKSATSVRNMTMYWARLLFDWCMEQPDTSTPPLVVDAHDLIHSPQIVFKICERLGLDKSAVQFEWNWDHKKPENDITNAEQDRHQRLASIMLSSLHGSSGIIEDKAPVDIYIAAEVAKWKVEFGEEIARFLERAVIDSMPDYEYLRAQRITI